MPGYTKKGLETIRKLTRVIGLTLPKVFTLKSKR